MTFRGTAAHLRRAPGWRRSGDQSYWESLVSEGEVAPRVPRPQSAIEGGQMDNWLRQLEKIQNGHLRASVHDQVPLFNDRTTSMPSLDKKEPTGSALRQQGIPSFYSREFSSSESPSLFESSLGSQESLQAGPSFAPDHRGSWERAHIMQAPQKEQAKLSSLAPVKIGWLPIQRRAMMANARSQNHYLDHSASQVMLKQPITPTFQKNPVKANGFRHLDGEVEKSHTGPSALGVRTWLTPDLSQSRSVEQAPKKLSSATEEGDRPLTWQAVRRGWAINKTSPLSGESQADDLPTRTAHEYTRKTPLRKTSSVGPQKSHTPLSRTVSLQPVRTTVSPSRTDSISRPSHIETSSAVTTLVPQNKAGFSSITISSKKVTRSASLPGSNNRTSSLSGQTRASPSLPLPQHPMDPNPNRVTLQRKATIVKVTEHRMTSSPAPCGKDRQSPSYNLPGNHGPDTVVHRRKATIIKVTEHRESYSPAKAGSGTRNPEYRHSYTEGVYRENSVWRRGPEDPSEHINTPSYRRVESPEGTNYIRTANTSASVVLRDPEKHAGAVHRSTLSLVVSTPPTTHPKAVAEGSTRSRRPLSCYADVFGHTEPSKENATQPTAGRKWSFGLPLETDIRPVSADSSFLRPRTAVKETGQPVAESPKPSRDGEEGAAPPRDVSRRPSLTLIKAPDPNSQQSPEAVLALNAAAIIANIKLQRQLNVGECEKPNPDQSPVQHNTNSTHPNLAHAEFVPLRADSDPERSAKIISLQEALEKSRPGFITRSQDRVRELERRAQERRELADLTDPRSVAVLGQKRGVCTRPTSLSDNLFKPKERAITWKETQPRSKRGCSALPEVKRKKEQEKKREVCLTNRQRAELFRKKLLDQILQRGNN
ncbi:(E2-independent) E3 ubiquitin-conjugating enzyme FATS isoform 2-T2 [Polymixia lowei]